MFDQQRAAIRKADNQLRKILGGKVYNKLWHNDRVYIGAKYDLVCLLFAVLYNNQFLLRYNVQASGEKNMHQIQEEIHGEMFPAEA